MTEGPTGGHDRGLSGSVWRASDPPVQAKGSRLLTPAVAGSLVLLVLSAATSISWVVAHGGVSLPPRAAGAVAGASSGPIAAATGPVTPIATPSRAPAAGTVPTAAPTAPAATPARTPSPSPASDRYALLTACPGVSDCYHYTVRRGDNLWSISRWFGVSLDLIYERNPGLRTTTLRAGMEIVLPTPTR